jgi:hypothetical protein
MLETRAILSMIKLKSIEVRPLAANVGDGSRVRSAATAKIRSVPYNSSGVLRSVARGALEASMSYAADYVTIFVRRRCEQTL